MNEVTKEPFWIRCGDTTPRDRRNLRRFLWIAIAWAACFLGATYVIKHDLLTAGPTLWMVAALPSVVLVFVLDAYVRFLREADELLRSIQLHALALGFGAGWLAMSGYPLFERLGAPAADIGDYTVVMAVFYSLGSVLGWRRYR